MTPQRLSFVGGGTDFSKFYEHNGGEVLSSAIDKYVYVTVKKHSNLFNEKYRLSYSKTEHCDNIDDIENDIARECLRLVDVDPPLFISSTADLPASSGLGSSSSFAVGLLYALHILKGEDVSAGQLAEEACKVEIEILKKPIGKQDQYAAAFGGLNHISFESNGRVSLDHLWIDTKEKNPLFNQNLLFWTGMQRDSSNVLREQNANIANKEESLNLIKNMVLDFKQELLSESCSAKRLGLYLNNSWKLKKSLASQITNERIDNYYERAIEAGAYGGKLAGAGGGGFLYLIVPDEKKINVINELNELAQVSLGYEPRGARVLSSLL